MNSPVTTSAKGLNVLQVNNSTLHYGMYRSTECSVYCVFLLACEYLHSKPPTSLMHNRVRQLLCRPRPQALPQLPLNVPRATTTDWSTGSMPTTRKVQCWTFCSLITMRYYSRVNAATSALRLLAAMALRRVGQERIPTICTVSLP